MVDAGPRTAFLVPGTLLASRALRAARADGLAGSPAFANLAARSTF